MRHRSLVLAVALLTLLPERAFALAGRGSARYSRPSSGFGGGYGYGPRRHYGGGHHTFIFFGGGGGGGFGGGGFLMLLLLLVVVLVVASSLRRRARR